MLLSLCIKFQLNHLSQEVFSLHLKLASVISFDIRSMIERRYFNATWIVFESPSRKQIRKFNNLFTKQPFSHPSTCLPTPNHSTSDHSLHSLINHIGIVYASPLTKSTPPSPTFLHLGCTELLSHESQMAYKDNQLILAPPIQNANQSPSLATFPSDSTSPPSTSAMCASSYEPSIGLGCNQHDSNPNSTQDNFVLYSNHSDLFRNPIS
jgi:hypothetical protein